MASEKPSGEPQEKNSDASTETGNKVLEQAMEMIQTHWQIGLASLIGAIVLWNLVKWWINRGQKIQRPEEPQGPIINKESFRKTPFLTQETYQELKKRIQEFAIPSELKEQRTIRVLVVGPFGCGKSSFYSTIDAALKGYWRPRANIGREGASITGALYEYNIQMNGNNLPFVFCDTMGLGEGTTMGIDTISQLMDGYIKKGASLASGADRDLEMSEVRRRQRQIHVVVFVADCTKVDSLSPNMKTHFQNVRMLANQKDIPMLGLLTKVDLLLKTPDGKVNLSNLFFCEEFRRAVDVFSRAVQLPELQVHGIMNYHDDYNPNVKQNALAMIVLEQITTYAGAYLENRLHDRQELSVDM